MADGDPDVLIVGSGAGGGAAAWRLATRGIRVRVLDAGPQFDPARDFRQDRPDWETAFPTKDGSAGPYAVAPLQPLTPAMRDVRSWSKAGGPYVTGDRRAAFGYHHVRGVGGSSLHFTGEAHRLNPRSMRMRTDHGMAADWPVSYAELEPYWTLAETVVGVAGPALDRRCPRGAPYPQPAHRRSFASAALARGAVAAGLTPVDNSLAVLSRPRDGRPDCNGCGGCLRGCQRGDKGSVDVTYLREAQATGNCEVVPMAEVLQLTNDGRRVTGAVVAGADGLSVMRAPVVIVAAGAIQTPRLLLNSRGRHAPDGLANESGMVGRNFMETLLTTTSALHPDPLGSHRGLPVDWVAWDHNAPDAIPGVIGGCRFGPAMAESDLVGPIGYASRIVPGWGDDHRLAMRKTFGRVLSVAALGESLPHPGSYVDLDAGLDRHGMPVARIHSHLDDMALDRIRFMMRTCRDVVAAAGCTETVEEFGSADAFSSTHVFGTCRMGTDPEASVVDAAGRSHRWPNLFVCDASVFPSSGGGEAPGLTIQALALRTADGIAAARRGSP
ncbi:GMC family oxidoreductase [Jannaschia sp. LMIT008]|uniref:GMC family oxidoreductase n=1 Tax=Jannaschia maritima TaxID=3032585 RepID=UPI0028112EE6|nr:GMC family oxidoreductase [Jannaschia sp. LMIT008]